MGRDTLAGDRPLPEVSVYKCIAGAPKGEGLETTASLPQTPRRPPGKLTRFPMLSARLAPFPQEQD